VIEITCDQFAQRRSRRPYFGSFSLISRVVIADSG
jgi:hypothetical protein